MQAYEVYWQQTTQVLGWTFLHFLWQGVLIALLYAVLRNFTRRPTSRYTLGILALFAMALAPALTAWRTWQQLPAHASEIALGMSLGSMSVTDASSDMAQAANSTMMSSVLPWLGAIWLCGVLLLSLNSLRHWRRMHWLLRHDAAPVPEWQCDLLRLCDRFAIWPRVRLLQSSHVITPTLIGWIKPIILLPVSVLGGFTPQQIEMIIAHELGHVRRWDYLLNLFQVVLETVLFYHPAVHWISRDVRNVRETCCDDLVIELGCGSPLAYAHTLANLEGLRAELPAPALAANGGMLLARVRRIVGMEHVSPDPLPMRQQGWLLILFLLTTVVMGMRMSSHAPPISAEAVAAIQLAPARMAQQAYAVLTHASVASPAIAPVVSVPVTSAPVNSSVDVSSTSPVVHMPARQTEIMPAHSVTEATPPVSEPLILSRIEKPQTARAAISVKSSLQVSDIHSKAPPLQLSSLPNPVIAMPKALHRTAPVYPAGARENNLQGHVSLSFSIAVDGSVQNIEVVDAQGAEQFVEAASDALRQWSFDASSVSSSTERYTQAFDFALGKTAGSSLSDEMNCKFSTGSHICRRDMR